VISNEKYKFFEIFLFKNVFLILESF